MVTKAIRVHQVLLGWLKFLLFKTFSCTFMKVSFFYSGRLAFHGIDHKAGYLTQKEATQVYVDRFLNTRLERWLSYFERVLKNNNDGKG